MKKMIWILALVAFIGAFDCDAGSISSGCGPKIQQKILELAQNQLKPILMKTTYVTEFRGLNDCKFPIPSNCTFAHRNDPECKQYNVISCNYYQDTKNSVFSENYDWHSSVAAYWALLSIISVTSGTTSEFQRTVYKLNDRWKSEMAWFKPWIYGKGKNLMFPIGMGWFALLASQIDKVQQADTAWVKSWLKKTLEGDLPFPENPTGKKSEIRIRGDHYSWLYTFFLAKSAADLSRDLNWANDLKDIWETRATKDWILNDLRDRKTAAYDFIQPKSIFFANQSLVFRDFQNQTYDVREWQASDGTREDGHPVGEYLSRLLPFAIDAEARRDSKSCGFALNAIQAPLTQQKILLEKNPLVWKSAFIQTGHWIPQAIWLVLWNLLGRP